MFSLYLKTKHKYRKTAKSENKIKLKKKDKIKNHTDTETMEPVLCMPSTFGHGAFPEVWLTYLRLSIWRKSIFSFLAGINC